MPENKIVLLGTKGGPRLTTGSSWPSSSVVQFAGRPYIVDCGLGVTRQFVEAGYTLADLHTILITHHHSDHNLELGPLLHTTWTTSPMRRINVYGPPGLIQLVDLFFQANAIDVGIRQADEGQADPRGMFNCLEYTEGHVFRDDIVEVSALKVVHPPFAHCYALKFESADRTVVFSSDTSYFPPLAEFAKGADVLVHEVMHRAGTVRMCDRLADVKPNLWVHLTAGHTFGDDVGRIASGAGVEHLVVQHFTPSDDPETGPSEFAELVCSTWNGPLTVGQDLTVIPF